MAGSFILLRIMMSLSYLSEGHLNVLNHKYNRILDKCGQNSFDLFKKIWAVQDLATFLKFASWTHNYFWLNSTMLSGREKNS